jgi:acyl-CoA synthetase (AMP-forming)/AMP-acid ligase II
MPVSETPRRFADLIAAEIPRNASGKILKKVLREPFWAGRASKV